MSVKDNIGSGNTKIVLGNGTINQDTRKSRYHVDVGFKPDFIYFIMKRSSGLVVSHWHRPNLGSDTSYPVIIKNSNGKIVASNIVSTNAYGLEGGYSTVDDTGFYIGHPTTVQMEYEYIAVRGIPDNYKFVAM